MFVSDSSVPERQKVLLGAHSGTEYCWNVSPNFIASTDALFPTNSKKISDKNFTSKTSDTSRLKIEEIRSCQKL